MKKKGFTLIELLAVIVILAIIALIATPIILNMINNARKSAAKSSTYGYIEAIDSNNGFADAEVEGYTKIEDGTYDVSEISVRMKGKAPEGGEVTITSGKVTSADICMNGFNVEYNGHEAEVKNKCVPIKNITVDNFNSSNITWEDIRNAYVKDPENLRAVFNAGTTKNVTLTDYGTHPVRIANLTPCSEVEVESKTSCGLVLEFTDIIAQDSFSASSIGGWPASTLYNKYFKSTGTNYLYNNLPSDLKGVIIDTTVVSGHASSGEDTTTTDKLFIFSMKELNSNGYDSADSKTRVVDYYIGSSKTKKAKTYNGNTSNLWTRTVNTSSDIFCRHLNSDGSNNYNRCSWGAANNYGFSPAFRLSN